ITSSVWVGNLDHEEIGAGSYIPAGIYGSYVGTLVNNDLVPTSDASVSSNTPQKAAPTPAPTAVPQATPEPTPVPTAPPVVEEEPAVDPNPAPTAPPTTTPDPTPTPESPIP
ncbi:MAG: penicillin-binding protein, partial [Eubacterium sp.]